MTSHPKSPRTTGNDAGVIPSRSIYQNLANSSRVEFYKTASKFNGKEIESCCLVFTSSTKREFRHFYVLTGKGCAKKRDARAELLFC